MPSAAAAASDASDVKKKEEEALIMLLKERALRRCGASQRTYYECVKGRLISVAWACREEANSMNACLSEHTTDVALSDLKRRWVRAGRPSLSDRDKIAKLLGS